MNAEHTNGMLSLEDLERAVREGKVETVLAVFPDLYGRLVGKRIAARYFLDHVAEHGMHACDYLFTVDMEMDVVEATSLPTGTRAMATCTAFPTGPRSAWRLGSIALR